jgi:hypothetical protein
MGAEAALAPPAAAGSAASMVMWHDTMSRAAANTTSADGHLFECCIQQFLDVLQFLQVLDAHPASQQALVPGWVAPGQALIANPLLSACCECACYVHCVVST